MESRITYNPESIIKKLLQQRLSIPYMQLGMYSGRVGYTFDIGIIVWWAFPSTRNLCIILNPCESQGPGEFRTMKGKNSYYWETRASPVPGVTGMVCGQA